ncbi:FAD-dependent thymidylate synthase [Alkalibacter saccharofermentans]|uniref:Flavin-dependent thymidylate synthase n=1 Tax=Alkalibacter saccharofermentans DSM 14828 TaxID=1120975 RepID=A0A1M4YQC5_9FIRM|nr:FAD-dependent thymidylate synthase [Alkalibacter saccharofermentans]SHF07536.1 thymidylate synthase (FAD) [Alkalibacter saccharofermentans DSM 14828]
MEVKLKVELLQHTPQPEKLISAAAKLCYSKSGIEKLMDGLDEDKVNKFLEKLMEMGHESPIEHVSFTFGIEGVSRSLTHQLVRHRVASYSQKSQRYVTEAQFQYIIPPQIAEDERTKALYVEAMEKDQAIYDAIAGILKEKRYNEYLENGESEKAAKNKAEKTAIEDARYVLPNACETKIIATMNARELLHFFNHRCCERAQWEIRELATQMLKLARDAAPLIFKNAGPNCVKGPCPEGQMTCGKIKEIRKKFENL